jgi:hypothetical protein
MYKKSTRSDCFYCTLLLFCESTVQINNDITAPYFDVIDG